MSKLVSWCIYKGVIYFLDDEKLTSRRGKELKLYDPNPDNWMNHELICWFYGFERSQCIQEECTNFSSPENFPDEIASCIKACKFTSFGVPESPEELLNKYPLSEYENIRDHALSEYKKIRDPAWVEYEKIEVPAWAEYEKRGASALPEYKKIRDAAWANFLKFEYPASSEYKKIRANAFWTLFKHLGNRTNAWK